MNGQVVEWAPFRLNPGVSEEELLRSSERLQRDFLESQPGYLKRELIKGDDGGFVDVVWWRSLEEAHAVMKTAMESPVCATYFALMHGADQADPAAGVKHFRSLRTY
jgi:hypothetical protein